MGLHNIPIRNDLNPIAAFIDWVVCIYIYMCVCVRVYKLEQLNFHDCPFKKIMAPMPNQWFLCSPETDHDNSKPGMISIPPIFMTRYGKSVKMDVYGIGFTTLNCIDMVVFFRGFGGFFAVLNAKKKPKILRLWMKLSHSTRVTVRRCPPRSHRTSVWCFFSQRFSGRKASQKLGARWDHFP